MLVKAKYVHSTKMSGRPKTTPPTNTAFFVVAMGRRWPKISFYEPGTLLIMQCLVFGGSISDRREKAGKIYIIKKIIFSRVTGTIAIFMFCNIFNLLKVHIFVHLFTFFQFYCYLLCKKKIILFIMTVTSRFWSGFAALFEF